MANHYTGVSMWRESRPPEHPLFITKKRKAKYLIMSNVGCPDQGYCGVDTLEWVYKGLATGADCALYVWNGRGNFPGWKKLNPADCGPQLRAAIEGTYRVQCDR